LDEPEIKRPRLDDNTDPSLEDEAVLTALAAHTNPAAVDHYGQEYVCHLSRVPVNHGD